MNYIIENATLAELKNTIDYILDDLGGTLLDNGETCAWFLERYPQYTNIIYCDVQNRILNAFSGKDNEIYKKDGKFISFAKFKEKFGALPLYVDTRREPDFYMGFEIEGCVRPEARQELINYICEVYPESSKDSLIHYDGSVYPKKMSIEIVTPPLPEKDAIERLEWVLGTLSILSEEGLFQTNHTCGFHVNLSEKQIFQKAHAKNRNNFAFKFLNKLDALKWKKAFGRTRGKANNYCVWLGGAPKTISEVVNSNYANHYSAINTQHLHKSPELRRIEVRVAGGKDYHMKHDKMNDFFLDISDALKEAHAQV